LAPFGLPAGFYIFGPKEMIDELERMGIMVEAYGNGFRGGRVSQEEMIRLFSVAKINLGLNPAPGYFNKNSIGRLLFRRSMNKIVPDFHLIHNFNSLLRRGIPQIKGRHFEIPACGGFVVTSPADDLENYYVPGKETVLHGSMADLAEKIRYYLKHDEEREAIARAGYERTLAEHTYQKRFKALFGQMGLNT
ncbi:MAG: glycosyltransferase, partial [Patescibacteria group bacterium]